MSKYDLSMIYKYDLLLRYSIYPPACSTLFQMCMRQVRPHMRFLHKVTYAYVQRSGVHPFFGFFL